MNTNTDFASTGGNQSISTNNTTLVNDDYIVQFSKSPTFNGAAMSGLIIALPSAVDTLLDMVPEFIVVRFFQDPRHHLAKRQSADSSTVMKMSNPERFMFCVGCFICATCTFPPLQTASNPTDIWFGFSNANTCLILYPIIAFLVRCSRSITPPKALFLALLLFMPGICSSTGFAVLKSMPEKATLAEQLSSSANIFMLIAVIVYSIYLVQAVCTSLFTADAFKADLQKKSDERFRVLVVGAHMCSLLISVVLQCVWFWIGGLGVLSLEDLTMILYSSTASAGIVFIVEFRVRKNEFVQALYTIIESKRSYIRYISHELRTPMNAAFLGIKLVCVVGENK
jgi:hypothetical protein